jgi:hypothetical protein
MSTFDPGSPDQGRPDQPAYPSAPQYGEQPGNAPAYSGGYGEPAAPAGPPPETVKRATWAMYAALALSLISVIVTVSDASGYKDAIRRANVGRANIDVDSVYTAAVAFSIVLTVLVSALYIVLALNLLRGRNWARITTYVVVGIFILLGLLNLRADAPGLTRVLQVLVLLANIATLVLISLRPSSQFFASRRAVR